jgi:hypothetical protein
MDELERIKRVVSSKKFPEPLGSEPLPHEVIDLEKMIEETPKIAPIFVRIDRYKDILERINDLKKAVNNIQTLLQIRKEMHLVNTRSDEILERALEKFSEVTSHFSREFTFPRGIKYFKPEKTEIKVDDSILKLSEELERLKSELEKLEI